jgi:NADH:ubiquinone oxidoreductase subunit 3 (subunit A)
MNSLIILFFLVPILVIILLILNVLLAVSRPDTEKVTAYECGFNGLVGQTRSPFRIQYYLVGMLFMIFDLEILLAYPYFVSRYVLSNYGFIIVIIFFVVLTLGFVYEICKGVLYFTDNRSSIRPNIH